MTCQTNERVAFVAPGSEEVKQAFAANNVVPVIADLTDNDPVITNFIFAYGYSSIPVNIVIPGDNDKPAIAIDGPIASGKTFIEMVEMATR